MALGINEIALSTDGLNATSATATFAGGQPASGKVWIAASGVYFPDNSTNHTMSAPASLTSRQDGRAGGNLSGWLQSKSSSGSDGSATTANITPDAEGISAVGILMDDAVYDTSGKANDGPSATSLTITTDASVSVNSSLALAIVFKRGNTCTVSMSGWTLEDESRSTSTADVEAFIFSKTVNSGSTASGTFNMDTGTGTRINGFIIVLSPSNVAPTVTAPATDDCVVGVNEDIGAVFTVADTDSNLDTIRYQCVAAHGGITVTLSGDVTVTAGTNGTDDFTITGSHANLLTVHATAVFNATTEDTQNITVTATDDQALSASDTVAMTSHYLRITNATQAGLNTTLGTGVAVNTDVETAFVDLTAEDSGERQSAVTTTQIVTNALQSSATKTSIRLDILIDVTTTEG